MKKIILSAVVSALIVPAVNAADKPKDGLNLKLQDQVRYEGVTQDNTADDATAVTNRFVLGAGYKASGFGAYVEATNVAALTDTYKDTAGNGAEYSVVKDPAQTRLTQAKLNYRTKDLGVVVGRDMYTLDGHRFMGHVAWRQMPQTFDLAALCYKGVENLKVKAAYVFGRHTVGYYDDIMGTEIDGVDQNTATNSIMLNANYKMSDKLSLRFYDYMISSASDTIGAAVIGTQDKLGYKVEVAMQKDATMKTESDDADTDIGTATYTNIEVSYKMGATKLIVANEIMGAGASTGDASFQTPWATLHKFNGWADVYLGGTPTDGLSDTSIGAVYKDKTLGTFKAFYHSFSDADFGNTQGSEIDLAYARGTGIKGLKALLKAALYTADTKSVDTTKVWAMLTYNFKK